MAQKRNIPTKKQIFNYWKNEIVDDLDLDLDTCWGCGFTARIERCHLHDRFYSKNDNASNLVLLCHECHIIQENMCKNEKPRLDFIEKIKQGPFLMGYKINFILMKVKLGIYDSCMEDLGYTKEQIEQVKNYSNGTT
jgi:hypothetical protein